MDLPTVMDLPTTVYTTKETSIDKESNIIIKDQPKRFTEHKKFTGRSDTSTKNKVTNSKGIQKKGMNLYCYNKDSIDARCCGFCYCIYPNQPYKDQCNICPNNFYDYWNSGYIQTDDGPGSKSDGICCWLCFPVKFGYFFSCCLGSICNGCINSIRDTNVNYLF